MTKRAAFDVLCERSSRAEMDRFDFGVGEFYDPNFGKPACEREAEALSSDLWKFVEPGGLTTAFADQRVALRFEGGQLRSITVSTTGRDP